VTAGTEKVLERSRPKTSVEDIGVAEIKSFLAEKLRGLGVRRAFLFGSVAEGTCGAWSDIDVVVVYDTDRPFVERPRDFEALFDLGIPVDILAYTPEEFDRMGKTCTGFWKEFERTCVRIV